MKNPLYIILFLMPFLGVAQFSNNAPWMTNNETSRQTEKLTLAEISSRANTYFNQIDKNKKGSGYKPFKRSEYHWSFYLEEDGTIATADKLWRAWKQKKAMQQNERRRDAQINSNWQPIGPYDYTDSGSWSTGQGRVNCVAVDPVNNQIYYVGAPAGGLWKSTDAGITWTPLTDNFPQIGVSGIAIDKNNHDIIYITTGDDDAGNSYFVGVMKSTDGGATWNTTGNLSGDSANEIYIDPTNSNVIWVATSAGLHKSTDAATTWVNKKSGNIKDFRLKPGDPNTIYAVNSYQFFKSSDGGDSFIQVATGLPSYSSRLVIDVTPANPNCVYIVSARGNQSFQGVYKSIDSGGFFMKTAESNDIFNGSNQAWYDLALAVSDTDENTLFVGDLNIWRSTNGGDNFTEINQWDNSSSSAYTHGDIHFLRYFNGNLFTGTDGRVAVSKNNGASFTNLTEGIAIGQFYKISVSKQSSGNVVGGLQDNGGFGYSNNHWYNYHGADGMDAAVDPLNQNVYYGFIQNGGILYKTTQGGQNSQTVMGGPEEGNWVTPLVMSSEGMLYAGYSKLYMFINGSWTQISSLSTNFGGKLDNIEIDPSNSQNIYVSKGATLFLSSDSGVNYTDYTFSDSITSIEVHNTDSNILWVTTSSGVYKSVDKGVSWTEITGNLPSEGKNIIRHLKNSPNNSIYVGTNLGVYYKDDTISDWQVFSTNLPNVKITDLEINENDNIITASTYGRGVWQSSTSATVGYDDYYTDSVNLYPNPTQGIFTIDWPYNESATIKVFDITGKVILQQELQKNSLTDITLPSFAKGMYFVKFITYTKGFTKKLLVE